MSTGLTIVVGMIEESSVEFDGCEKYYNNLICPNCGHESFDVDERITIRIAHNGVSLQDGDMSVLPRTKAATCLKCLKMFTFEEVAGLCQYRRIQE